VSTRYPGGIITKTPVVPAGPYENGTAPGIWTLDQQLQAAKAGIWPLAGNVPNFIEDVFSTYLYTGNGSTQTITNGVNLSANGGLVWMKGRTSEFGTSNHWLQDTVRGVNSVVFSNSSNAAINPAGTAVSAFNTTGFSLGSNGNVNNLNDTMVSWTFREQPKFFDIVTYTGTGSNATISHNLGSEPGCIIVKRTDAVASWYVYHRGLSGIGNKYIILNSTAAEDTGFFWTPTSTTFNVSSTLGLTANGGTYVAYLFAHNAGGFGLTGTDNVISCGSYVGTGVNPGPAINLGYEPQFIIVKNTTSAVDWFMYDTMRGMPVSDVNTGSTKLLRPNTSAAEQGGNTISPTATGFQINTTAAGANTTSDTYIYIAIRRGPMKVPTDATKVFSPVAQTTTAPTTVTTNFPVDMEWWRNGRSTAGRTNYSFDRLRGGTQQLRLNSTVAEQTDVAPYINYFDSNVAFVENFASAGQDAIFWSFRRAPGFFDEFCYTGTGSTNLQTHNLGVTPELLIIRSRSQSGTYGGYWQVLSKVGSNYRSVYLNTTDGSQGDFAISSIATPTTVNIQYIGSNIITALNVSAATCVAYLFATVAGVSKVGSYTGTGSTQTINCGFTAGSRFVMIKRADSSGSTGDWYVWDSARGIVAGNDPYLWLNSTAAEVTNTDYVDTAASGFEISSTAPAAINANGGTFIFLAIA
jgi:hypothetical protein